MIALYQKYRKHLTSQVETKIENTNDLTKDPQDELPDDVTNNTYSTLQSKDGLNKFKMSRKIIPTSMVPMNSTLMLKYSKQISLID